MKTKSILLLGVLGTVIGCGKSEGVKIDLTTGTVQSQEVKASENEIKVTGAKISISRQLEIKRVEDLSNLTLADTERLNTFVINAKLDSENFSDATLSCYKESSNENGYRIKFIPGLVSISLKVGLKEFETDQLLKCKIYADGNELTTFDYQLRKTFLVNKKVNLQDLNFLRVDSAVAIERLILTKEGTLVTNGESLTINANQVISSFGKIVTFDNAKPSENRNGRSGGVLTIYSNESIGSLKVFMKGEDAGIQTLYPQKNKSVPLAHAEYNSQPDSIKRVCEDMSPFIGGPSHGHVVCHNEVRSRGRDGLKGDKGNKGLTGYQGNAGGDSGIFRFIDKSSVVFSVDVQTSAGKGSDGGQGGEGSDGGAGGAGGAPRLGGSYGPGPQGDLGDRGDSGIAGRDGQIQNSQYKNVISDFIVNF